jgi:hypothetical protein
LRKQRDEVKKLPKIQVSSPDSGRNDLQQSSENRRMAETRQENKMMNLKNEENNGLCDGFDATGP